MTRYTPARNRISEIIQKWFLNEPLLFSVWTTHHVVSEPTIRTVRVRRGRFEYNPAFIDELSPRMLDAVLKCEAVRILLKHPYSRRKENRELAYLASNVTIQEYFRTDLPFPTAKELFGTDEFNQQYFEFYYYKLQSLEDSASGQSGSSDSVNQEKSDGNQPGAQADQADDDSQSGQADGSDSSSDGDAGKESVSDPCSEPPDTQKDAGSSRQSQQRQSPEEAYADRTLCGKENTWDWDTDEFLNDKISEKIRSAEENSRWGSIPGKLREKILATLKPKLDYRAVLRLFRTSVLSVNRVLTRMKPSRRYGFLYMGSRRDFTTRILFAVDVSGSISSDDLMRGFSVINRFFKYGVESVDVIQFDTEIKGKPLSLKKSRREIRVVGRGGTDFAPVMEYIDENRFYDGLIIFTDGWAPAPPKPKNRATRILWLFNSESNYQRFFKSRQKPVGKGVFLKAD